MAKWVWVALVGVVACGGFEGVGENGSDVKVCAGGSTIRGVDVSHWDGKVDWAQVKASGIQFAFTKATEGTSSVDSTFVTNWAAMKSAGIARGAYHFFHPEQSATAQATFVAQVVGTLEDDDLPIVCDLEEQNGVSASATVTAALAFLDRVTQLTGKTAMLYASPGFLASWGGLVDYPLWVANYGVSCPMLPMGFSGWNIWQSSESGTVSGVGTNVDLDEYNGTLSDLLAFANGTAGNDAGAGSNDAGANDGGTNDPDSGTTDGGVPDADVPPGDCTLAGIDYAPDTCTDTLECANGFWIARHGDPNACTSGIEPNGGCLTDGGQVVPQNTCTSTLQCDDGVWVGRAGDPNACL